MKINREEFLRALESVQPGLAKRENQTEQGTCLVFKSGEVHTFNDEMACRCPSNLPKEIEGAVQAQPLLDQLRKWTEDEIDVGMDEGELLIVGKARKAGIRMEAEIVLPIDSVEKPKSWTAIPESFGEAIGVVESCAGSKELPFIHLHPKWVEASDRFQICRWKMRTGVLEASLVRATSIKHVATLGMTELSEGKTWLHFRNPSKLVVSCRRYLEDFPELTKHLEVVGKPITLPKGLIEASEKANVFSVENADENLVVIDLRPGKMRIEGRGISGWYRETRKLIYDGPEMTFLISPKMLSDMVNRHSDFIISEDRLKADGGGYVYVACLSKTDENNGKEEKE